MTALSVRLQFEPLRTIAFGDISGVYAPIGTPFDNPCRLLYIVNNTDVLLTFSDDGVNDKFVIPAGSYILIDIGSNKAILGGSLNISQGTTIYVAGTPSMGNVFLTTAFGGNG
jgi:hypothetical protein